MPYRRTTRCGDMWCAHSLYSILPFSFHVTLHTNNNFPTHTTFSIQLIPHALQAPTTSILNLEYKITPSITPFEFSFFFFLIRNFAFSSLCGALYDINSLQCKMQQKIYFYYILDIIKNITIMMIKWMKERKMKKKNGKKKIPAGHLYNSILYHIKYIVHVFFMYT